MTFDEISLAAMKESPVNPRKHFDEARLAELAESIKQRGIIAPLLVRPCGDGTYEIAAGHRRYRAAKLAGLVTVPVGIREMDDREFMEVLTVENLQREDIHPLEEAQGYQELQSRFAYDVAAIADKIDKPEAYVYGRLQLCSLIPVVQTAFLSDEITIGHARLISRLEPSEQENALAACFQRDWTTGRDSLVSVAALKNHIRNNTGRNLERAPFDLTMALGDAIACVHCSKAAGVNPLLVDPDGDKICLDSACYQRKVTAHVEQLRSSGLVAITTNWNKGAGEGVVPPRDYEVIEAEPDQSDQDELAELRVSLETEADEQARQDLTEQSAELERHIADQVEKPCGFAEQAVVVDGYEPLGIT
jgi:ParB family chromosome partitioning protein